MKFSRFQQKIQKILETELPPKDLAIQEGLACVGDIRMGRSAFMEKMGVNSELEYKRQGIKNRQIMYHAHIGMNTWQDTKQALTRLHCAAEESGFIMDRAGICLDRRMGLPPEERNRIPAETGPMLETPEAWMEVGQLVPIQPHMGDFMIGFPASVENTRRALAAGVTTIGNLSQFFAHEVPTWTDSVTTAVETVKAISIMGALQNKGVLVHSYLEDGFGALFHDCATIAGWALLEKYIVEELLGAKISHCIGGLTSDPVKRAGWVFGLHEIHRHDGIGSMFYGDTISFDTDDIQNQGRVAEYLMWDIMAQLECPGGHAVLPLPVTEALRIPSATEIAEAQWYGRQIEAAARRLWPHIDFSAAHEFSSTVVAAGKTVFENAMDGLKAAGLDVSDPVRMLYVLKALGPADFEAMFGAGKTDAHAPGERQPVVSTDIYALTRDYIKAHAHLFDKPGSRSILEGRRILLASTDVHEHAIAIMDELLTRAGAEVINLGAETGPDQIARTAGAGKVEAVMISTHNGMALEYARRLKAELAACKIDLPIVMGGILNQKVEDTALPVDVTSDLKALGFYPSPRLEGRFRKLLEPNSVLKKKE
ncbi:MAG: cobalamin-dependent protein [Deltaproteobacteria bacterium]|jgi:methylmalonyl-CoA mutase cobalamin-binding subunit|nr:cobalamin-dependent protein [Deltaproteobacteria bacterium]